MTNYRALCVELVQHINSDVVAVEDPVRFEALLARARAELNKPEPVEPTNEQLEPIDEQLAQILDGLQHCFVKQSKYVYLRNWIRDWTRHKLARWGRPAITPTPVSERPWERNGWRDAQGTCWMWHPVNFHYCLCLPDPSVHTHSLPHWALHLPPTTEAP